MKKQILKITEQLCSIPTAPFREQRVIAFINGFCKKRKIAVRSDNMGNLIATYGGKYKNEVLAFCAHMDHPGFIIEKNSKKGKTTALFYGGVEESYFKGTKIKAFTDSGEVKGAVLKTEFNRKKNTNRVFLQFKGEVSKGDFAMWNLPEFRIRNGRIYTRSCDDTMGVAAILALFDVLHRRNIRKKVLGVFTMAEEVGLHGAKYLCMKKKIPAKAKLIAIETSRELPEAKIGAGVIVRVGDAVSIFNPATTAFLTGTAVKLKQKDKEFEFQRRLMYGGRCESSVYQEAGYTCGAVCLALGNYHNRNFRIKKIGAEYVSVYDLVSMVKLFIGAVKDSGQIRKFLSQKPPKYKEEKRGLGERLFYLKK